MKIVSFAKVIPLKNTSIEKINIIYKFIKGVNYSNIDSGYVHEQLSFVPCDVAIIQGWQHEKGKSAPHLKLRQEIIDTQLANKKFVITADSNLFLYSNPSNNPHHYLRYSINGVFPNTGNYCDNNPDPKRWQQISKDLNIQLEPMKTRGKTILLCIQRNGGWSMGNIDVQEWIINTVQKIRKHSDRPIVIRPHPGDKKAVQYLSHKHNRIKSLPNITLSKFGTPLETDLSKAWCVVNHNSSSIVGPIIQGFPAFITDPDKSQCAEVAHTDFSKIENPDTFDRQTWVERISMFHWKFSELEDGSCWKHMRDYCQ